MLPEIKAGKKRSQIFSLIYLIISSISLDFIIAFYGAVIDTEILS